MKKININQLRQNQLTTTLYTVDSNFENLVSSISLFGVLEPLVVFPIPQEPKVYQVVSGNRRLSAVTKLGLTEVPCTIIEPVELTESRVRAHQEYREKQPSDIIRELRILEEEFGLRQGARGNDPKIQKAKEYKACLVKEHKKSTINRLRQYDKKVSELVGEDSEAYSEYMNELDRSRNISGSLNKVIAELKEKENRQAVPENYMVEVGEHKIFPKSSDDVTDLADCSVQMVVTSPPYFNLRDYKTGKKELGREKEVSQFVKRLVNHFSDYKRILKDDGTLWVNLGDFVVGPGYDLVPERFAIGMLDDGWILHDRITWAKNNPQWTNGNRSVMSTESIMVFKKNYSAYYNLDWLKSMEVENDAVTIGTIEGKIKLRSFFDFRDNVLVTSIPNNHKLKKACEVSGMHLTHDATFPLSIPVIAILTGSKEGDVVLDPFSGTATTGKACQILDRNYVGYEMNPTYMRQGEIRLLSDNDEYAERLVA